MALLVVTGSFCMTLVQLSKGLHEQLVLAKQQLHVARKQLLLAGAEHSTLLEKQLDHSQKSVTLREKSSMLSAELLDQQKKVKLLQYQLLASRQELKNLRDDYSESMKINEKQFNITMRFLMNKIVNNREYSILLKKHLEDRVTLERSLELVQNKLYNSTNVLKVGQQRLQVAATSISTCKSDNTIIAERLKECNNALSSATKKLGLDNASPEPPS